jgi:hypothetical protein
VDQSFIHGMQVLGGLPTEYSFGVGRGQADYQPNSNSVYVRVRQMTDQIFIRCM